MQVIDVDSHVTVVKGLEGSAFRVDLLADGSHVTLLDWSNALLAPRAYDVGYTALLLSEPPLRVPGWQRPRTWPGRYSGLLPWRPGW